MVDQLFNNRLFHFDLEAIIFEDRDQLDDPPILSEFMILDCGALDPRPTRAADVSHNLQIRCPRNPI